MSSFRNIFFILILYGAIKISVVQGTCEKCMDNMAYCVDATHFRICLDGENPSLIDGPHACPPGTFCTNSAEICAVDNPPSIVKGCSTSSVKCNVCSGQFACVSRTQFALCRNNQTTSIISSCESGQVCSIELFKIGNPRKICAPSTVLEFLGYAPSCSNQQVTTILPPTTPSRDILRQHCETAESGQQSNRFFYIRNADDATCRTYVYCERINNVMEAILFTCKTGYFDSGSRSCVQTRPANCPTTN